MTCIIAIMDYVTLPRGMRFLTLTSLIMIIPLILTLLVILPLAHIWREFNAS